METNKPNIFYINRSEIEGQLNPSLYKERFYFKSDIFPIKRISEIAYVNPNTSFNNLKDNDPISFVPMESIDEENGFISKKYFKSVSDTKGFTRFLENDLIWAKITPCMQNGKSAIVRNTLNNYACGSTEFFIIRPKNDNVLVEYLHLILRDKRVLNVAKNYFGGSAGQQRVSKDFLLNYKIPLPPKEIQQIIVDKINQAYHLKQEKEKEAKRLLDSIDGYLLGELGITLPEIDNSLENRVFISSFSEVTENRLDSYYHQKYFKEAFECLNKTSYNVVSLKNISNVITSGITPKSGGDDYTTQEEGIAFVRSGNININGDLIFDDLLYLKPDIHYKTMKSSQLKYGDLMIAIVGATIGQVGIYLDDLEANINQAIALVRLKDGINRQYVKELIKSSIGQLNLNRLKRPVARANINLEEISTMQLILPPIEKQNEIAEHISRIREEAKRLQFEAKEILEKAKLEVERMILGK